MMVAPSFGEAEDVAADGFDVPLEPQAEMVIAVHSSASAPPFVLPRMSAPE